MTSYCRNTGPALPCLSSVLHRTPGARAATLMNTEPERHLQAVYRYSITTARKAR